MEAGGTSWISLRGVDYATRHPGSLVDDPILDLDGASRRRNGETEREADSRDASRDLPERSRPG